MTSLSEKQLLGRAQNAVSSYFARKLVVPKIYLDADWNRTQLEILAIDRAGVGDVHAVRMIHREANKEIGRMAESVRAISRAQEAIAELESVPSHYKYVALISGSSHALHPKPSMAFKLGTFAPDGVGRVAVLYIDLSGDEPRIDELVKPERFRSSSQILSLTDEYVATHTANMEYREPADFQVHA